MPSTDTASTSRVRGRHAPVREAAHLNRPATRPVRWEPPARVEPEQPFRSGSVLRPGRPATSAPPPSLPSTTGSSTPSWSSQGSWCSCSSSHSSANDPFAVIGGRSCCSGFIGTSIVPRATAGKGVPVKKVSAITLLVISAALIGLGVYATGRGFDARDQVREQLLAEEITTPAGASIPNARVDDAATARSLAQFIDGAMKEATGGRRYSDVGRYLAADGTDTNDAAEAAVGPDGQPVVNPVRRCRLRDLDRDHRSLHERDGVPHRRARHRPRDRAPRARRRRGCRGRGPRGRSRCPPLSASGPPPPLPGPPRVDGAVGQTGSARDAVYPAATEPVTVAISRRSRPGTPCRCRAGSGRGWRRWPRSPRSRRPPRTCPAGRRAATWRGVAARGRRRRGCRRPRSGRGASARSRRRGRCSRKRTVPSAPASCTPRR